MNTNLDNSTTNSLTEGGINFEAVRYLIAGGDQLTTHVLRSYFNDHYDENDSHITPDLLDSMFNSNSSINTISLPPQNIVPKPTITADDKIFMDGIMKNLTPIAARYPFHGNHPVILDPSRQKFDLRYQHNINMNEMKTFQKYQEMNLHQITTKMYQQNNKISLKGEMESELAFNSKISLGNGTSGIAKLASGLARQSQINFLNHDSNQDKIETIDLENEEEINKIQNKNKDEVNQKVYLTIQLLISIFERS